MTRTVTVVAAVVEQNGTFLVTRRLKGTHLEGFWEFPGGKCHDGESHHECLAREMREELAVGVTIRERILAVSHDYPDRTIALHFYACDLLGDPAPQLGQELMWVARQDLPALPLPPADDELVRRLTT